MNKEKWSLDYEIPLSADVTHNEITAWIIMIITMPAISTITIQVQFAEKWRDPELSNCKRFADHKFLVIA